jgi:hypothetical protein
MDAAKSKRLSQIIEKAVDEGVQVQWSSSLAANLYDTSFFYGIVQEQVDVRRYKAA